MANPILQMVSQQNNQRSTQVVQQAANNPIALLNQFQQFRQQMAGKDPQQMVNELVQTGRMSQAQFEQLKGQAQNILSMFHR